MSEDRHLGIDRQAGSFTASLPRYMDMLAAEDLKRGLTTILDDHVSCSLDVSAVEKITTPCIQVLLAFLRDAEQMGLTVTFTGKSEALNNAIVLLGLAREFRHITNSALFD